jgi:hypothetical protein
VNCLSNTALRPRKYGNFKGKLALLMSWFAVSIHYPTKGDTIITNGINERVKELKSSPSPSILEELF